MTGELSMMEQGYSIKEMNKTEIKPFIEKHRDTLFAEDHSYTVWSQLSEKRGYP